MRNPESKTRAPLAVAAALVTALTGAACSDKSPPTEADLFLQTREGIKALIGVSETGFDEGTRSYTLCDNWPVDPPDEKVQAKRLAIRAMVREYAIRGLRVNLPYDVEHVGGVIASRVVRSTPTAPPDSTRTVVACVTVREDLDEEWVDLDGAQKEEPVPAEENSQAGEMCMSSDIDS